MFAKTKAPHNTAMAPITINTAADRFNLVVGGTLILAGAAAGAVTLPYAFSVPAALSALFATAATYTAAGIRAVQTNELNLAPEDMPKEFSYLRLFAERSGRRMGMVRLPQLNIYKPQEAEPTTNLAKATTYVFTKLSNACAFGIEAQGSERVVYSQPLIDTCTPIEEMAVTAHEMGHLAANHFEKSAVGAFTKGFTSLAFGMNLFWNMLTPATIAPLATSTAFTIAALSVCGMRKAGKQQLKPVVEWLMPSATAASLLAFGQKETFVAFALFTGVKTAVGAANAFLSRGFEYQADRISVETMGKAEPLVSALVKIDDYNQGVDPPSANVMQVSASSLNKPDNEAQTKGKSKLPLTARILIKFSNGLARRKKALLQDHPPLEARFAHAYAVEETLKAAKRDFPSPV